MLLPKYVRVPALLTAFMVFLAFSSFLAFPFLPSFFLFLSVISRKESHYFILVLAYLSLVTKDGEHIFTYIDLLYKDFF